MEPEPAMTPSNDTPPALPRRIARAVAALSLAFAGGGCQEGEPVQSVLDPAAPAAATIEWLWWLMFWTCTVVFVAVMVLLVVGLVRGRGAGRVPTPPLGNTFIVISGIILPAIVLVVLLVANLRASLALREPEAAMTIRVTGFQWWWEVEYPEYGITIANELQIPTGKPIRLELRAADVIHSFWVPRLAGKMDMIPGMDHTNLTIRASEPGVYRGQCAEFCGIQHALMALSVVALPPEQFDAWVAAHRTPPPAPADEELMRGKRVFAEAACGNCHAIAGTQFNGQIGPDLTFMGSRRTIGAGTLPNTFANLSGWISNPQPLKPGNLMPPSYLGSRDLLAVTAYLESLK
jgi:cytochrome c oxidase subunit 2